MRETWLWRANELSSNLGKSIQGAEHLWHFTALETLTAILHEEGWYLRFSDYRFLNDPLEGKYYRDVFLTVAEEMLKEHGISERLYSEVQKAEIPVERPFYKKESNSMQTGEYKTYIACFSSQNDSLPMWNYYAASSSGSCGIEFGSVNDLQNCLKKENGLRNIKTLRVIYDRKEQERCIRELLGHLSLQDDNENIPFLLQQFCIEAYLRFKQPACEYEQEIRLMCEVPEEREDKLPQRKFRNKNGLIIPYIDLFCSKKRCIKNVILGPLSSSKLSQIGVKDFLEYNKYNGNVLISEIKMRY